MYNRLFTKILDSSIWLEPLATRIVWVTLIAAMDQDGIAHFSALENLAARARVSCKQAEEAVKCFLSPDPNSADPDNEGRRVERIAGGYLILNAAKYREIFSREVQREQTRKRVAKFREKQQGVTPCNGVKQNVTQSEAVSVSKYTHTNGKACVFEEMRVKISAIYGQQRRWSNLEESLLAEISRLPGALSELETVLAYRSGLAPKDKRYFPQSVSRLLETWNDVLDKAATARSINPAVAAQDREIASLKRQMERL